MDETTETLPVPELDADLIAIRDILTQEFPQLAPRAHRGELTVDGPADALLDILTFAKTSPELSCELLSDVSAVHWPAGVAEGSSQETTGWPTYSETTEQGTIELSYILRSVTKNHWFRLVVSLPDENSAIASATGVYSSANVMEREVFDMAGVHFIDHPNLTRIMMPDDWEGHPQRKDYPLGGVEVMYKGHTIAPPDERDY